MQIQPISAIRELSAEIVEAGLSETQFRATVIVLLGIGVFLLLLITLALVPCLLAVLPVSVLKAGERKWSGSH